VFKVLKVFEVLKGQTASEYLRAFSEWERLSGRKESDEYLRLTYEEWAGEGLDDAAELVRQHTPAYVSIRQHTSEICHVTS